MIFINLVAHPAVNWAVGTFVAVAVILVLEAGWRRRHRLNHRATVYAGRRRDLARQSPGGRTAIFDGWLPAVAKLILPVVPATERRQTKELLEGAGFRHPSGVVRFFGMKVASFVFGGLATLIVITSQRLLGGEPIWQSLAVLAGAFVGNLGPELMARLLRRRRQEKIRSSLANAIDLMIITANAGQSLDVAMARVAKEIARMAPELADELAVTTSELQALPSRRDALENLARRTGVTEIRSLTATLIQTIRYGTPLSQSLKALAHELRQTKLIRLEEKAAKLPALLSLPLMLLIMPAVFIVTAGPAVLNLIDAFSS